jgi:hypothetical protein
LNGQDSLQVLNPSQFVGVQFDVRAFSGAGNAFIEISRPNQPFSNPNGVSRDPLALAWVQLRGTLGGFVLLPRRDLPGYGEYYIRVIPLDRGGSRAVGRFSNSAVLRLGP